MYRHRALILLSIFMLPAFLYVDFFAPEIAFAASQEELPPSTPQSENVLPQEIGAASPTGRQPSQAQQLQVFLPPVLEKKKPFWGSIYELVESQAALRIFFNEKEHELDDFGVFHLIAPDSPTLTVKVQSESGATLFEALYHSCQSELLVSDKSAVQVVERFDALNQSSPQVPVINHAPSAVEANQAFVVLGKNFSGKQGENEVEIDNRDSDILASSPRSIVAVSNKYLSMGPIKELKVLSGDLSSVASEVDVACTNVDIQTLPNGKKKISLRILGTTLPLALVLSNESKTNLRFGGWRLGSQNVFLSPGGSQNAFSLEADQAMSEQALSASLISNGLFDPYSLMASKNILSNAVLEACESAEFIRLKKREIALVAQQASIEKSRLKLTSASSLDTQEETRLENNARSCAARLYRIEKMLQSRRITMESYGKQDFTRLFEAAAETGIHSLEGLVTSKDLGFTEARLLKVVGKRAAEERARQSEQQLAFIPQYTAPPAAILKSYQKKYGKKGYIPPPPQAPALIPPPAPFRVRPEDLGPFVLELPKVFPIIKTSAKKTARQKSVRGKVATGSAKSNAGGVRKSTKGGNTPQSSSKRKQIQSK